MRSSTLLASCFGTLAIASPLHHAHPHNKKAIVWDIVTDVVVVTITTDAAPSTTPSKHHHVVVVTETDWVDPVEPSTTSTSSTSSTSTSSTSSSSTSTSTSSTEAPIIIITTTEAAPVAAPSTTSTAPVPVAVTTEEAAPAAATTAATTASVVQVSQAAVEVAVPAAATTAPASSAAYPNGNAISVGTDIDTAISNHGTARASHSVSALVWNETLAVSAAQLAASCAWGHSFTYGGGGYGQNIAAQGSSDSGAQDFTVSLTKSITDSWYTEAAAFTNLYGQSSPTDTNGDWTHFTQMVWKSSESVGCAVAACGKNVMTGDGGLFKDTFTWYTVCNYYPVGNVEGYFADNVLA